MSIRLRFRSATDQRIAFLYANAATHALGVVPAACHVGNSAMPLTDPSDPDPAVPGDAPREPLSRQALGRLRRAILSGALAPGERLVEERLSADFGMSRVPIREAIKLLVAEGLAVPSDQGPGKRGVQVAALTPDFARDLIEVRAVLEGLNARLAARHRKAEALAGVRRLLEQGQAVAVTGEAEELVRLNAAFHDLLVDAGANRVLQELMRPLRERTELVFRRNGRHRAVQDWQEHAMILWAVAEGDEELAALLATRHVHNAARARLQEAAEPDAPA